MTVSLDVLLGAPLAVTWVDWRVSLVPSSVAEKVVWTVQWKETMLVVVMVDWWDTYIGEL